MTPAPLTITADDQSKLYGRSLGFRGTEFTARGLVNGDAVTSVDLASRGASRGAQVGEGPFRITASNAEGEGLANYTISYVEGLLRVTPAPLVVTADDQAKRFGQEFVFNGTEFTARGLVNGDAVTSALLRSDGAPATALPSSQPYAIDISDAQGQGLSFGGVLNYDITYVPGELLVVPPPQQNPARPEPPADLRRRPAAGLLRLPAEPARRGRDRRHRGLRHRRRQRRADPRTDAAAAAPPWRGRRRRTP